MGLVIKHDNRDVCMFSGCGHCKKAKPEFMAAAAKFVDDSKVKLSSHIYHSGVPIFC